MYIPVTLHFYLRNDVIKKLQINCISYSCVFTSLLISAFCFFSPSHFIWINRLSSYDNPPVKFITVSALNRLKSVIASQSVIQLHRPVFQKRWASLLLQSILKHQNHSTYSMFLYKTFCQAVTEVWGLSKCVKGNTSSVVTDTWLCLQRLYNTNLNSIM